MGFMDKAKGFFKRKEEEDIEKKPEDLLENIKRYESKISERKPEQSSALGELEEEAETGGISRSSFNEIAQALGVDSENIPKDDKGVAVIPKGAEKQSKVKVEPKEKEKEEPAQKQEKMPSEQLKEVAENAETSQIPQKPISEPELGQKEDKLDSVILLLTEIRDLVKPKKRASQAKKAKKAPSNKAAKKGAKKKNSSKKQSKR